MTENHQVNLYFQRLVIEHQGNSACKSKYIYVIGGVTRMYKKSHLLSREIFHNNAEEGHLVQQSRGTKVLKEEQRRALDHRYHQLTEVILLEKLHFYEIIRPILLNITVKAYELTSLIKKKRLTCISSETLFLGSICWNR